ncbi:nitrite reductase small subunit NirD [Alkalihalobacillus pseudalcaliphilus]|uniref:nitrite reductase small subunit NirD n=1 Tax=Alkalihalobacillus pseudalcaliphilus TaxID=79884 RepID=UPI000A00CEAA|nr:nitrite reductase small subunit NirD [Alkalihalobacillus pseudalcaliphilus]
MKQLEKTRVLVANKDVLVHGLGKQVIVNGHDLALFLLEDGRVHAIENRCPHKGGPLADGIVSGEHVFCPLHDWKISTATGEAEGADEGCVRVFEVELEEKDIYILLNKEC